MHSRVMRIAEMETRLKRVIGWLEGISGDVQEDVRLLDTYYHSLWWRSDYEIDEAEIFPADRQRGLVKEAVQSIHYVRYRRFQENDYEVVDMARQSDRTEPMVVYRALHGKV